MIDGQVFDDDRVDQTAKLGNTEEWTIVNTDQQYHSFHIHQTAFLVTEITESLKTKKVCGIPFRCLLRPILSQVC
jgi:FtsP/CotA-like multicopper oxidase with cupredoxin domain